MKTLFLILFSASLSQASDISLANAKEFQFVHCHTEVKKGKSRHYIFDIRAEKHAYYLRSGDKLVLQDSDLNSKPDSDDDVTWLSKKTGQKFKLYISDNAGYLMKGNLIENGVKTPVDCSDVTQEK